MDDEWKPRKRRSFTGYIVLIVIAVILAICLLRPLGLGLLSSFQQITSALGGQQR